MLNSELVSRVINDGRFLSKDEHISRRYVLAVARNKATFLIAQKFSDRTLYREDDLITHIDCFHMKPDNVIDCDVVAFRRCNSVMVSKEELPALIYSKYGNSIISVSTIDGSVHFNPISVRSFANNSKRELASLIPQNYYYVKNKRLYLPNSSVEIVNLSLVTLENDVADEVSSCKECNCDSVWDKEFVCPDKLTEVVIQETIQEVLNRRNIRIDENPNLSENQIDDTVK